MIPYRDTIPCEHTAWVTWSIIVINFGVFLACLTLEPAHLTHLYRVFGLVPARYTVPEWAQWAGVSSNDWTPLITSLFLHGSWMHLITNAWMLWIFGDNVEDRMGAIRFTSFYLICGVAAGGLQFYANPQSMAPMIGASGALAGVMGAYFFMFPYARIVIWVLFMPLFIQVPAISFLGAWVIFQLYKATTAGLAGGGFTDVAWWGHLGGFIAGVLTYRLFLLPGRGYSSGFDAHRRTTYE